MEARENIVRRRLNCGDKWIDTMGDGAAGAVQYVIQNRRVPREVLCADAEDALSLVHGLDAELDRLKYDAIMMARQSGVTWIRIATRLGLRSAPGAERLYLRLRSLHAGPDGRGPRDADAGRQDKLAEERRRQAEGQREGWALSHARAIEDAAREVLASPLPVDEAENAEEVEVALGAHPASPGEVWEALRVLLPGLPEDALTPMARNLTDGLLADWDTRFPSQDG